MRKYSTAKMDGLTNLTRSVALRHNIQSLSTICLIARSAWLEYMQEEKYVALAHSMSIFLI